MVDLSNMVGTMVVGVADSRNSYIAGASDRQNEEFQKNTGKGSVKDVIPEGSLVITEDMYESMGIRKEVITSENYNDFFKISKMPANCLTDQNGKELMNQSNKLMHNYYAGGMDKEDVKASIIEACKAMRIYQAQCRHITGNNKENNLQILSQIYELFQKQNVRAAAYACFKKGDEIAQNNGKNVYYDSSFYYESEEIRECLQAGIRELAQEWGTDVPDFEEIEENTLLILDGKMDFNSCWEWQAWQRGISSIKGYEGAPPRDFSFFYQSGKYTDPEKYSALERQKGFVQVTYQGKVWEVDVPFNNSLVFGEIKEIFNVRDLLLDYFREEEFDPELLAYLGKFDVYTRWHGSKLWAQMQNGYRP